MERHITIAKKAGTCFGVKRAIDLAKSAGNGSMLGRLVHNPQVMQQFENNGMKIVDSIEDANNGTIVIGAHGVSKEVIQKAVDQHLSIVDTTCPFVQNVHQIASEHEEKGYKPIILGDKDHIEVEGIVGDLKEAKVVSSKEDAVNLPQMDKVCFVSQTTQPQERFDEIVPILKNKCQELKIFSTICVSTRERQQSATELAKTSDIMIIIGGKISANTKRLHELCS